MFLRFHRIVIWVYLHASWSLIPPAEIPLQRVKKCMDSDDCCYKAPAFDLWRPTAHKDHHWTKPNLPNQFTRHRDDPLIQSDMALPIPRAQYKKLVKNDYQGAFFMCFDTRPQLSMFNLELTLSIHNLEETDLTAWLPTGEVLIVKWFYYLCPEGYKQVFAERRTYGGKTTTIAVEGKLIPTTFPRTASYCISIDSSDSDEEIEVPVKSKIFQSIRKRLPINVGGAECLDAPSASSTSHTHLRLELTSSDESPRQADWAKFMLKNLDLQHSFEYGTTWALESVKPEESHLYRACVNTKQVSTGDPHAVMTLVLTKAHR